MAFTIVNPLYPKPHFAAGSSSVAAGIALTVGGTTSYIAANFDSNCELVFFDVQTASVYVTFDGQVPSATVGSILTAGTNYTWQLATMLAAKFAPVSANARLYANQFAV